MTPSPARSSNAMREKPEKNLKKNARDHAAYVLPHGTLQFLLAAPIALLPALLEDGRVGLSEALADAAVSAGTAANAVGKLVNGVIIDRVGASTFASVMLAVASLATAAFVASSTKFVLLSAFLLLQFAASGGWLIGCRVIHDRFVKARWSSCFAILSIASRTASMASKLSLGALLASMRWHDIGLVASGIGAVGWMLSMRLLSMRRLVSVSVESSNSEEERTEVAETSTEKRKLCRLLKDGGLLLYCGVMAGATCVAAFENLTPLILKDLTSLSSAQVSMTATVFPAALLLGVATIPPLLAKFASSRKHYRWARLAAEVALLGIASCSAIGLAALAARGDKVSPFCVVPLIFGLAFGVSITFYITPNVYALDFGGKDCATASSLLDTFGLAAASLWSLCVSFIQSRFDSHYVAWAYTMTLLALILTLTAFLSIAALSYTSRPESQGEAVVCNTAMSAGEDHVPLIDGEGRQPKATRLASPRAAPVDLDNDLRHQTNPTSNPLLTPATPHDVEN